MNAFEEWVPLSKLGPEAVSAYQTIRTRRNYADLPRPSRVMVRSSRRGKFTTIILRTAKRREGKTYEYIVTGTAAKNPIDDECPTRARMLALSRAVNALGEEMF